MKSTCKFCFVCIVMFCFAQCDVKPDTDELDRYFSEQFPRIEPGGAVLITKLDSVIFSKGYGIAGPPDDSVITLSEGFTITPKTLFNLGSISKTFVSNAILILNEQGKLSLEDSIIKYFPEFRNREIAEKVRIKHLLNHTSGLPDNRQVWKDTVFYLTAKDAENWHPVTQAEKLRFEPGSKFEYSNPAYNGLALIVEKVSGQKWQDFVAVNIFRPAGMPTSTITDGPHPERGVAHGYVKNQGKWIEDDYGEEPTFPAAGNGGVWSSIEELAKYEQALRKGLFLKSETVKDSRTPKVFGNWLGDNPEQPGWSWFKPVNGWSWFVNEHPDGYKLIGHTGTQGGFIANYVSIPEKEIFFVILCNSPRDVHAMSDRIMTWLQEEKLLE